MHRGVCHVSARLWAENRGEHFFAVLDDVCVVCTPELTKTVHDLLVWRKRRFDSTLETRGCGTNEESASQECDCPPEVWSPQGVKILRTPVGTKAFENVACGERIEEEKLWNAIHWIPDLQCAWQVLVQCVRFRCHHTLHTMLLPRSLTCA